MTDDFTRAANAEAEKRYDTTNDGVLLDGELRQGFKAGSEWARDYLAEQAVKHDETRSSDE